jgi:hypothetical protein
MANVMTISAARRNPGVYLRSRLAGLAILDYVLSDFNGLRRHL